MKPIHVQVAAAALASVAIALPAHGQCDGVLYVSSDLGHEVLRYNASTGAFQDTFIPVTSNGSLDQPHGILERENDVIIASFGTDQILRYDRETGDYLGVFIDSATGLDNPVCIVVGPDGNIYISSQAGDEILRFSQAGVLIDAFVAAGSGGLDGPSGFAFGPDGRLYVSGRYSANVIAYSGADGSFDEVLLTAADGLTSGDTFGLAFGDNDDLYVASNGQVFRYDVLTDTVVATISLGFPIGVEFGPSGDIIVASSNNLRAINTSTNALSGPLLTGGAINLLNFFHYAAREPDPPADVNCDGVVNSADYAEFATCLAGPVVTPSADCLAAFDGDADGDVDLADFNAFALLASP